MGSAAASRPAWAGRLPITRSSMTEPATMSGRYAVRRAEAAIALGSPLPGEGSSSVATSEASSPKERPGRPVSTQPTGRPGSGPGLADRPARLCSLAEAAVVAPVVAPVLAVVAAVVAAVLAPVAAAVDAVGDHHGTADGGNGPPAASGCKRHVRLLPRRRPRSRPAPLGWECARWRLAGPRRAHRRAEWRGPQVLPHEHSG